jgi:hypothetical protein
MQPRNDHQHLMTEKEAGKVTVALGMLRHRSRSVMVYLSIHRGTRWSGILSHNSPFKIHISLLHFPSKLVNNLLVNHTSYHGETLHEGFYGFLFGFL